MILCLESSLLGGYLSNEVPGLVTGMLHVAGSNQPVRVEMVGNFLRDIAGCRVDLHNPLPHGDLDEVAWLAPQQFGFSGVMTASYRVAKLPRRRSSGANEVLLPEPQGLKNLLFLEWFNQQSQRVLIQSWHLQMRVSAPRWKMSEQEEATLLRQARARRKHFLLNQRGTQDKANALHAPGMPDPFEPHDLGSGDPFATLEESPSSLQAENRNERKPSRKSPAKRSEALAEELRRFEHLLVFNEEVRTRPAVMHLLSTVADLTAHLVHVLRQFSDSKNAHWPLLVVDLEQSLPLFAAALNATDKMILQANPGTDLGWLSMVQASLLNIELRMRELLTMLR
jgi:hypothetical protein